MMSISNNNKEINNNENPAVEVILRTGFQRVSHDIAFRAQALQKCTNLVKSNHVYLMSTNKCQC